jgi:hypothetical protein
MPEPDAKELEEIQRADDVDDAIRDQVEKLEGLPAYELVRQWGSYDDLVKDMNLQQGLVEMVLTRQMVANGAKELQHATHEVKLKQAPIVDRAALTPLLEMEEIPPEELAKAYTPPGEKIVKTDAAWSMTGVKPLMKYGGRVKKVIEDAQSLGPPRLVIKKKEERGIKP